MNEQITDVEVARITVIRYMGKGPDDDFIEVLSSDGIDRITALGMLRAAEVGILESREED